MAKIAQGKKILLRIDKGLWRFFEKKWEKWCAVVDISPYIEAGITCTIIDVGANDNMTLPLEAA